MLDNTLGILALFRNESHILEEWIEHHLDQGVDHFYLIDNSSDDDYISIVNKYNNITIINQPLVINTGVYWGNILDIQEKSYMDMLPSVNTKWLMIIDIDEFVYTRNGYHNIKDFLIKNGDNFDQIIFKLKLFNSNNHIIQPTSVIDGFTSRVDYNFFYNPLPKSISKTNMIKHITAHFSFLKEGGVTCDDLFEKKTDIFSKENAKKIDVIDFRNECSICDENELSNSILVGNHYSVQSEDWFFKVKATRGVCGWPGSEFNEISKYFENYFKKLNNRKRIDDFELKTISKRWKNI